MFISRHARIITTLIMIMMVVAIPLEASHQSLADYKSLNTAASFASSDAYNYEAEPTEKVQDHWHEVIVKWKYGTNPPSIPGTKLVTKDASERLAKLAVDEGISVQDVIAFAQNFSELEYIQPNYRYKLHTAPNDPEYVQQWHHQQINMERAWDIATGNADVVIAVLDTGVDLEHPDLMPNLVPGYNIINPEQPPIDDYGHGTQVAGVLGAVGNNQLDGTGILWHTRIMPIKVLDGSGEGDDFTIGQGIRHAVRNGADIIVLSLGDRLYSKHMEEAVKLAEQEGVLLIAATGNNGSTVNYPAAFPTVLAVGASDANDRVPSYSNFGPEVDVVAPGQGIFTTTMRGQMTYNSGTSMSAPIVAGIAALILKKHPEMEPWQVRQLIRQSAVDISGQNVWNQRSGYGRVDAYQALTVTPTIDIWSPNRTWEQAKEFPQGTNINSALNGVNDIDWFYIDVRHRGKVQVPFTTEYRGISMNWYYYDKQDDQTEGQLVPIIYSPDRTLEPGRYYIRIRVNNWEEIVRSLQQKGVRQSQFETRPLRYRMEHRFEIAADRYEPNNTINQAALIDIFQTERFEQGKPFVLIEGTLHQDGDFDWYKLDLPHPGELSIEVVNSYGRMDPVLTISKTLTTNIRDYDVVDDHAHGAGEFWRGDVSAGEFYFMVADYQLRSHPIPYQVKVTFNPSYEDRWEPNDTRLDAPNIVLNQNIYAFLDGNQDRDWFTFFVEDNSNIKIELTALLPDMVMEEVGLTARVFEATRETPSYIKTVENTRHLVLEETFSQGVYYIQLLRSGNEPSVSRQVPYMLQINNLSAESTPPRLIIEEPVRDQVFSTILVPVSGISDPGALITINNREIRAGLDGSFFTEYLFEGTGIQTLRVKSTNDTGKSIERAIQVTYQPSIIFSDVITPELQQAVYYLTERNIVQGFPDGTFRPNRSLTRGEIVTLILRALNVNIDQEASGLASTPSIRDVDRNHWAFNAMKVAIDRELIIGFADQSLRPDQTVTRAQLAVMLYRAFGEEYEQELDKLQTLESNPIIRYIDVPSGHWAYQDIKKSATLGYLIGFPGQIFLPDQAATRQQVAFALFRFISDYNQ
ncbi:S8 family serine peptidase [Desulfuribacillus alkaliarsenatis]|uniref:SLH domain-containing protein n=1 Tax=Desulfuribacillus alkaliarsenatis TaxID=766136 RepID=A0A1E5G3I3_9FIRM|nr:S8 family serine peptidase [Desulfuribacillus alkaliarsenatis]OEF97649.1 hypothetical protein BHF68_14480 [Desulfuribacillus alkaliarsenatis]